MKLRYLMLLPCLAYAGHTQAEIYKHVDANGNVTYSNTPIKGGKKLDLGPLPTMSPYKESDADSVRVKRATQRNRDEERRRILQDELSTEETLLAEARQNLKDTEDNPQVSHGPGGKTFRNVAGYEASVKAAQEQVTLHERNIQALKVELSQFQ